MKRVLLTLFALFVVLIIALNRPTRNVLPGAAAAAAVSRPEPPECLVLEKSSAGGPSGIMEIGGVVRNDCGRDFRYVEIRFRLLGDDKAVMGTAWTNQTNLAAGERWRFKASTFSDATRYRLESISAR